MGGRDVDARDAFGCSALHYAARRGATVSCLLLIKHGAQVSRNAATLTSSAFAKSILCHILE